MERTDRIIEIATHLLAAQLGTENEVTVEYAVNTAFKLDKLVHERMSLELYGTTNLSDII